MEIFNLRPEDEFIELMKLLKFKQIAQTGGHAKIIIEEGQVKVNGKKEFQKRKKLRTGDIIEVKGNVIKIAD